MCGLAGVLRLNHKLGEQSQLELLREMGSRIAYRGPDDQTFYDDDVLGVVFRRLSIVDIESGPQPLTNEDNSLWLWVNGEIYNHKHLAETLAANFDFKTASDCEVLLGCYEAFEPEQISEWLNQIKGMFAFILYDRKDNSFVIARDPIGIIPLYTGYDAEGNFYVASEMKARSEPS